MLQEHTPTPAFSLPDQNEKIHTLEDYKGQWLLIYFYPKDDTPGCTKEACGFRDIQKELAEKNCAVLGVSKDNIASHQKFVKKFDLNFPLLADESTEMIQAYGAWQEKSMYGKKYMGIHRMSVLVDLEGNVAKIYPNVKKAELHPGEVLEDLEAFMSD